jgi:hypothetical protein
MVSAKRGPRGDFDPGCLQDVTQALPPGTEYRRGPGDELGDVRADGESEHGAPRPELRPTQHGTPEVSEGVDSLDRGHAAIPR